VRDYPITLDKLLDRLFLIAEQFSGDPVGQIRAIVRHAAERIGELDYRGWALSNAEVELSDRRHPARQVCEHYKTRVREHLLDLARTAGFREPESLADGLLLVIEGAAVTWRSFGPDGPASRIEAVCETLMVGHSPTHGSLPGAGSSA
jgi:hypothetical protein